MNRDYFLSDFRGFIIPVGLGAEKVDSAKVLFDLYDISHQWGERLNNSYRFDYVHCGKMITIASATFLLDFIDIEDTSDAYNLFNGKMNVCWDKSLSFQNAQDIISEINQIGLMQGMMRGDKRIRSAPKSSKKKIDAYKTLSTVGFLVINKREKDPPKKIWEQFDEPEIVECIFTKDFVIAMLKTDMSLLKDKCQIFSRVVNEKYFGLDKLSREQITEAARQMLKEITN